VIRPRDEAVRAFSTSSGPRVHDFSGCHRCHHDARAIARARGVTTGAWIREVIEAAVSKQKPGDDLVPMSVLLAAEEYHQRRAS
jgi:methylphosphotriester-DNA--protein-cysteine methyltransferase